MIIEIHLGEGGGGGGGGGFLGICEMELELWGTPSTKEEKLIFSLRDKLFQGVRFKSFDC